MADTFSNDLRLRLQESGSNASTWGDLLNGTITNIASALGQGSEVIPNASTHTITLADGTADEARSLYLKCTGGGQACTVTLAPNTISKVWIIDNTTSYTLTFSQGSGANVAISAGAVKVIATDGAGSGAAVVDTLDGLEGSLSSLSVTGALTANGGAVFNEGSADVDFRVESDNSANAFFVQGSDGFIGIGTASPSNLLQISSSTGDSVEMKITNTNADSIGANIHLEKDSASPADNDFCGEITWVGSNDNNQQPSFGSISVQMTDVSDGTEDGDMIFKTSGAGTFAERMRIVSDGSLAIGTSSTTGVLNVYKSSNGDPKLGHFYNDNTGTATEAVVYVTNSSSVADGLFLQTYGQNGTTAGGFVQDASIIGSGTGASGGLSIMTRANADMRFYTNGHTNERMRIDSSGGIRAGTGSRFLGASTGASTPDYSFAADGGMGMFRSPGALCFSNGSVERFRLDSSGNLLISTTSTADTNTGTKLFTDGRMVQGIAGTGIHDVHDFYRGTNGSLSRVGNIRTSGSATSYNTSSDQRLKENIADADDAGSKVDAIQVRKFDWKVDGSHQDYGMIAQELKTVAPEAVSGNADSDEMMGVDYSKLVPMLVKEIQSLRVRVAQLEA